MMVRIFHVTAVVDMTPKVPEEVESRVVNEFEVIPQTEVKRIL